MDLPTINVEQSIPKRFEQIVQACGPREAIATSTICLTYDELNAAANGLAQTTVVQAGEKGDRVAILMRHDGPLIVAVLAVLKAGRVVLVLNSTHPAPRLREVLADAAPVLLITDAANASPAAEIAGGTIPVRRVDEISPGMEENHFQPVGPGDLAFLIYTSGSTGKPKGVMQTHRNIVKHATWLAQFMSLSPEDRLFLPASFSGLQGVDTLWSALLNGSAICPFPAMERGVTGLDEWLTANRITIYVSSPSLFRNFMRVVAPDRKFPLVRIVRLGGETATKSDFSEFQKHFPSTAFLLHELASSETCYMSQRLLAPDARVGTGRLPVGHAVGGVEIELRDEAGRVVKPGETGEIVVKSRYISPGYWRNEALTAQKFSELPGGIRVFHTGDLGRINEAGLLMHLGRKDARVKIRGYRIEVSEVENALDALPEIERSVVGARPGVRGDLQLAAWIVLRTGRQCPPERIRQALRVTLPEYMVPSAFIFLKTFPLSPNGKVDRDALQRLAPSTTDDTPTEAPATPTEMMLAEIWHEVFKRSHIGRHENFFDLGGDSLNAAVIAALVFERRGIELDLRMFLEFPTLADFAARIDSSAAGANRPVPRLSRVSRSAPLLLSFQQEHILFHARRNREVADNYTMASCDRILGPLQPALLRECMNFLVRRHEMLRTSFGEINGRPVQTVRDPEPASLAEIDLSGSPEPEQHARNLLREMAREPFDLERGPLMRFKLARLREHEHWLLSTTHHIIVDAWSRQIYFRELAILYEAKLRGEPPPLPENEPLQYADYCAWQRAQIQKDSPGFRESIAWWKDYSSRKPAPARSPFAWRHWWRRLLSGSPSARHLPLRHLRKQPAASLSEGWIWWGVEPETSRRLEQLARQEQATFYMTRLTAFAAMLAAEAGGPEVALVSYLSQRNRAELLGMFGHFVNDVALRLRCDLNHSFRQCLAETRRVVAAVQAHGEIPFEMLQDEVRAAGVEPVRIGIYFNVLDLTATRVFGGLKLTLHEQLKETMPLDFMLTFDESNEAQRCYVQFDARIYHPKRVRAFAKRLAELLDSVAQHPDTPLAGLLSGQR